MLNMSEQRELSSLSSLGTNGCGLMKRSRSSLFLSYIPKLIISGSKEEPSEKLVFFLRSLTRSSVSMSAIIRELSSEKRSPSMSSEPFSHISECPLNTISCVDSPIPAEE